MTSLLGSKNAKYVFGVSCGREGIWLKRCSLLLDPHLVLCENKVLWISSEHKGLFYDKPFRYLYSRQAGTFLTWSRCTYVQMKKSLPRRKVMDRHWTQAVKIVVWGDLTSNHRHTLASAEEAGVNLLGKTDIRGSGSPKHSQRKVNEVQQTGALCFKPPN